MIDKARSEDINEILAIINESNRASYRDIMPPEYFREPVLTLEQLVQDFEAMSFYILRSGQEIIGVVALDVRTESKGRIRWVYVLPQYQRKSVGTSLVLYVEGIAIRLGLEKLSLLVNGQADWAINFYKKLGYRLVERIDQPFGFDLIMEKELQ